MGPHWTKRHTRWVEGEPNAAIDSFNYSLANNAQGTFTSYDPVQPGGPSTAGWNHYTYSANNPNSSLMSKAGMAPSHALPSSK